MELNGKQRAQLRRMANGLSPIFQVGKAGITEELLAALSDALDARELIKLTVLEACPLTAAEVADALKKPLRVEVIQCIGRKAVLYRRNREQPRIVFE